MKHWRALSTVREWQRRGYTVVPDKPPALGPNLFALLAKAPSCNSHQLRLILHGDKLLVVVLEKAPEGRQRLWRAVTPAPIIDWSTVPATWFNKTVQSLISTTREIA